MTGTIRFFCSLASTRPAPGRVDSPPTSIMSAPCRTSPLAWATAAASSIYAPPSEKLSGVRFRTPIRRGTEKIVQPHRGTLVFEYCFTNVERHQIVSPSLPETRWPRDTLRSNSLVDNSKNNLMGKHGEPGFGCRQNDCQIFRTRVVVQDVFAGADCLRRVQCWQQRFHGSAKSAPVAYFRTAGEYRVSPEITTARPAYSIKNPNASLSGR